MSIMRLTGECGVVMSVFFIKYDHLSWEVMLKLLFDNF